MLRTIDLCFFNKHSSVPKLKEVILTPARRRSARRSEGSISNMQRSALSCSAFMIRQGYTRSDHTPSGVYHTALPYIIPEGDIIREAYLIARFSAPDFSRSEHMPKAYITSAKRIYHSTSAEYHCRRQYHCAKRNISPYLFAFRSFLQDLHVRPPAMPEPSVQKNAPATKDPSLLRALRCPQAQDDTRGWQLR